MQADTTQEAEITYEASFEIVSQHRSCVRLVRAGSSLPDTLFDRHMVFPEVDRATDGLVDRQLTAAARAGGGCPKSA